MAIESVSNSQAWNEFLRVARAAQERNPSLAVSAQRGYRAGGNGEPARNLSADRHEAVTAPRDRELLGTRFDAYA